MKKPFLIIGMALLVIFSIAATYGPKPKKQKKQKSKKQKTEIAKTTETKNILTWYTPTEGYNKAVKENKILLIDSYTDWCYWCKVMDKKTYADSSIIAKLNQYFVVVKFNPEVNATHQINGLTLNSDQLLDLLNLGGHNSGYPSTYFWKTLTDNNKISNYPGFREPDEFHGILNKFIQQ